jgi:hypothetical protein
MKIYDIERTGLTTGATEILSDRYNKMNMAWENRITVSKGTASAGTIGIEIKMNNASAWNDLQEDGNNISIDLSSITDPVTYGFSGDIEGWKITASSVSDGTFNVSVAGSN